MSRHAFPVIHVVFALALLTGSAVASAETWRIGPQGAGKLKIGAELRKFPVRLKQPLARTEQDRTGRCFYAEPASSPALHLMIIDEHLARFDVYEPGIPTLEGVQVGDSIDKLQRTYGDQLRSAPNFYAEDELDYLVTSADGRHAIRFETGSGKVTGFFAGDALAVAFVEGCL